MKKIMHVIRNDLSTRMYGLIGVTKPEHSDKVIKKLSKEQNVTLNHFHVLELELLE